MFPCPSHRRNTTALSYSFALRNREPLICFVAGKLMNNFLPNQGNYSQYTIQVAVDADANASLTSIFNLCPERGTISPLDRSILKASIKYDKIFDAAERRAHNGAPVPYPYVSDATSLRCYVPQIPGQTTRLAGPPCRRPHQRLSDHRRLHTAEL